MELLEYYHLLQQRKWVVAACALVGLSVAVIWQLLPPTSWEATGRLLMHESAAHVLVYRAGELLVEPVTDFWSTFQTIAQSRTVLMNAANAAGLTGPEIQRRLKPAKTSQPRRGQVLEITASAPTRENAVELTQTIMEYVILTWNQDRLARAQEVRNAVTRLRRETLRLWEAEQAKVVGARGGGLSPTDELARAEADLAATRTDIERTRREIAAAQVRVERARQALGQTATGQGLVVNVAGQSVSPREAELATLRAQLAEELTRRKPGHPEVQALKARIAELEAGGSQTAQAATITPVSAPAGPAAGTDVLVREAEIALAEAQARLRLMQEHESRLRLELPKLRANADQFAEAQKKAAAYEAMIERMDNQLTTADAEISRLTILVEQSQRALLEEGTGPAAGQRENPPDIEILDPAYLEPSIKSWPKFALLAVSALILGLVVGATAVLGLHYISTSFANEVEAAALLETRVLGSIPRSDVLVEQMGPPIQVVYDRGRNELR